MCIWASLFAYLYKLLLLSDKTRRSMKQVFSISFRAALFIILRKSYKTILVKLIRIANDPKIELYMIPLKMRGIM